VPIGLKTLDCCGTWWPGHWQADAIHYVAATTVTIWSPRSNLKRASDDAELKILSFSMT
jgi:hypothetical protein